jgi:hypothetical protein
LAGAEKRDQKGVLVYVVMNVQVVYNPAFLLTGLATVGFYSSWSILFGVSLISFRCSRYIVLKREDGHEYRLEVWKEVFVTYLKLLYRILLFRLLEIRSRKTGSFSSTKHCRYHKKVWSFTATQTYSFRILQQ